MLPETCPFPEYCSKIESGELRRGREFAEFVKELNRACRNHKKAALHCFSSNPDCALNPELHVSLYGNEAISDGLLRSTEPLGDID